MKFESSLLTTIVLFMSTSALGQSAQANPQYASGYEILTKNPQGQFQPYVNRLLQAVRAQWYPLILESAGSSNQNLGATVIEFVVGKDGLLDKMKVVESSLNASLDEVGSKAIRSAAPFPRIPPRFRLESMRLRFHFEYRQANEERPACDSLGSGGHSGAYSKDGEIKPPRAVSDPNPEYSEEARKIKYQGFVTLRTTVAGMKS